MKLLGGYCINSRNGVVPFVVEGSVAAWDS
jgi:hypothetical protein